MPQPHPLCARCWQSRRTLAPYPHTPGVSVPALQLAVPCLAVGTPGAVANTEAVAHLGYLTMPAHAKLQRSPGLPAHRDVRRQSLQCRHNVEDLRMQSIRNHNKKCA
jgi:hypothetical protein